MGFMVGREGDVITTSQPNAKKPTNMPSMIGAARELPASTSRDWPSPSAMWPISGLALETLVDLGLSDERIANYFRVNRGCVAALRMRYGI